VAFGSKTVKPVRVRGRMALLKWGMAWQTRPGVRELSRPSAAALVT